MVNNKTIDAKILSRMFLSGAKNLEAKKEWINELNVFPVPDGDTGTNMTLTIMSAASEVGALTDPDMESLAKAISSAFTLADIINELHNELDVRGVSHRGFFASITDFQSYYDANMDLIDIKAAQTLFDPEWPIYTRTNDSCPTHYYETAQIRNSVVSNGCQVEGTIENSILGRGCIIHKDAVIKNSVILSGAEIGEGVHVENQVVDKMVKILHVKEVVSDPALPGYIKRRDIL